MKTIAEITAAMTAIVDLAEAETRSMTDDEVETYESLEKDLKSAQKTDEIKARLVAYKTPIVGFPAVIKAAPKGDAALDFAFEQYLRTGQRNSDLVETFAQSEGAPTGGGYLVPDGFRTKLTERRVAFGGFMQAAEQLTTASGNPLEWPSVDDTSSSHADVVAEGAASAAGADITFGIVTLGAYRYAATGTSNAPLKVSVELLQDSAFDVQAFVARTLGNRIARKQCYDLIRGSGSGEPLGIMYGSSGTEGDVLSGTTAQNCAALQKLIHTIDPEYRQGAKWVMNDKTLAGIEGMLDAAGRPILVNALTGISEDVTRSTLFGYPVIVDQACPDVDTNDVIGIAFGNWQEAYIVRHVAGVSVLVNPYASAGYVEYSAWARMDGTIQNAYAMAQGEGV